MRGCAAEEGLAAARAYWPALVLGLGSPRPDVVRAMRRAARRRDPLSLLVASGAGERLLLLDAAGPAGTSREQLAAAVAAVLAPARADTPERLVRAVLGAHVVPQRPVRTIAAHLRSAATEALQPLGEGIACAPCHSLAWLTEGIDPRHAVRLMRGQLVRLQAHDHEHGTQLSHVLELALDHPNRNVAADAAFMHRNTFRRQLRTAIELAGVDLECPEERLALHLALKLRPPGGAGRRAGTPVSAPT